MNDIREIEKFLRRSKEPPKGLFCSSRQKVLDNHKIYSEIVIDEPYSAALYYQTQVRNTGLDNYQTLIRTQGEINLPFLLLYSSTPHCFNTVRYPLRSSYIGAVARKIPGLAATILLEPPIIGNPKEKQIQLFVEPGITRRFEVTKDGIADLVLELIETNKRMLSRKGLAQTAYSLRKTSEQLFFSKVLRKMSDQDTGKFFERLAIDSLQIFSPNIQLAFYDNLNIEFKRSALELLKDPFVRRILEREQLSDFDEIPIDVTHCEFCQGYHQGGLRISGREILVNCNGKIFNLVDSRIRFKKSLLPTLLVGVGAIPVLTKRKNTFQQMGFSRYLYGHDNFVLISSEDFKEPQGNAYQVGYTPEPDILGSAKEHAIEFKDLEDIGLASIEKERLEELKKQRRSKQWGEADNIRMKILLENSLELQFRENGTFGRRL